MDDRQLIRYSRHLMLPRIDLAGQARLLAGHVLLVGAGGLGSPAALYLASSGVGQLTLCDGDDVDLTNLQRQILHTEARLGMNKAASAAMALAEVNPDCKVNPVTRRVSGEDLSRLVAAADVVVDACDNFTTRHAINAACFALGKPLVSAAAIRDAGQISVFDPRQPDSPCYHCLHPQQPEEETERCATLGVFAPLVGVMGSLQAAEALRLLLGETSPLTGQLLLFDAVAMEWHKLPVMKKPGCLVCSLQRH